MKTALRILHLEDNVTDAELVQVLLGQSGLSCSMERVETRQDFEDGLKRGGHDLIISDFTLPAFNGLDALSIAREKRPEIPFVFVSGTIGEDAAIEALKNGATDYVLKDNMNRLEPAIRHAIDVAEKRSELLRTQEDLFQSEYKYRQIFECLSEAALLADAEIGKIIDTNRQAEILFGRSRSEILGLRLPELHPGMTIDDFFHAFVQPSMTDGRIQLEAEISMKDGARIPVEVQVAPIMVYNHFLLLCLYRDISSQKQTESELEELRKRFAL